MGVVGGSRHYGGPADVSGWACPACGADNSGPLAQGCTVCGAGRPGYRADGEAQGPVATRVEDARSFPPQPAPPPQGPTVFERWVAQHPEATLEEAFTAGFVEGVRAAHEGARRHARAQTRQGQAGAGFSQEGRMTRTIIAALTLFKDQVLVEADEEIATGEWASLDDVNQLLARLREQLAQEVARV